MGAHGTVSLGVSVDAVENYVCVRVICKDVSTTVGGSFISLCGTVFTGVSPGCPRHCG